MKHNSNDQFKQLTVRDLIELYKKYKEQQLRDKANQIVCQMISDIKAN